MIGMYWRNLPAGLGKMHLKDTHWIGGDPYRLEVYGWASYSPTKGILTLRNPSDAPQQFTADIGKLLQLPPGAAVLYELHSP